MSQRFIFPLPLDPPPVHQNERSLLSEKKFRAFSMTLNLHLTLWPLERSHPTKVTVRRKAGSLLPL